MARWQGLWRKEWQMMRGWAFGTLLASLFVTLLLPLGMTYFFQWKFSDVEPDLFFIPLIWMVCALFIPLSIFISSMNEDMKRSDVWLHTPSSIFQLFGVKIVFAVAVGILNFICTMALFLLFVKLTNTLNTSLTIVELFSFSFRFLAVFTYLTIAISIMGLFFRVVYLLFKQVIGNASIVLTIGLFIGMMAAIDWLSKTKVYEAVSQGLVLGDFEESTLLLGESGGSVELGAGSFYIGEIIIDAGFMILLFVLAATLFEKKVRL